jgi:type I restriction-modification system DNA methylase subunit
MYTKEEALTKVSELVERFADQLPAYKKADYNETLTRKDFIDPFFEALGWDINNRSGAWEAYREVIHEDKVKIGATTKAPDYSFRLVGGQRLFFVEAKKPSIIIKDDVAPAYQVRLYGWNAKLALSVVTDFEEFAIYDCSKKPLKTDKASKARLNYFTYKDYIKEFDFFWNTFSKQQVIKGGLVKFQQSDKKGTATVDKAFLENLDEWRKVLAANIFKNNPGITEDELNYSVQQIIDRLIFLRIAEDRALEPYGQLKSCLQNDNHYHELYRQFRVADDKYNSGLFHFKKEKDNNETPDNISGKLSIDNKVIKSIISSLYPPQSDFLFNFLPVEILGSAYEQFLGKQIVIKGSRAVIEDKPEVRKAGGVYYTPQYIVDYIVQQTTGKLCEGKTPKEISKLKIVDPACGSGSFLLGAYQYLLNVHKEYYIQNAVALKQKDAVLTPEGNLTTAEKKRILLNNIYGVDIDRNAVEVTKLSLLLKCMEGETTASISTQMTFFNERVLPSLEKNIKCGNSLVDLDYYDTEFDFGEDKKIKPFNWQQQFSEVFKQGGFDAVIGNPPYVNLVALPEEPRDYLQKKYKTCRNKSDLYSFFLERTTNLIKAKYSKFGFIVPHTWLATESFELLRKKLLDEALIESLAEMGHKVFEGVVVSTVIIIGSHDNNNIKVLNRDFSLRFEISRLKWISDNYHIDLNWNEEREGINKKLFIKTVPLEKVLKFSRGIKTSDDKRFLHLIRKNNDYKPVYRGRNIKAFSLNWEGEYIWYRPDLMKEKVGCLPHSKEFFEVPEKLVTQRVNSSMQLLVAYDNEQNYFLDTTNVSRYDSWNKKYSMYFIAGVLNSKLINYWYCNKYRMPTIGLYELHSIPIKDLDFNNKKEIQIHEILSELVSQIIRFNRQKQTTTLPEKIDQLNQRISYIDEKINKLVYELYGLSEEEIGIVEGR